MLGIDVAHAPPAVIRREGHQYAPDDVVVRPATRAGGAGGSPHGEGAYAAGIHREVVERRRHLPLPHAKNRFPATDTDNIPDATVLS